jgi:hypothetical protein
MKPSRKDLGKAIIAISVSAVLAPICIFATAATNMLLIHLRSSDRFDGTGLFIYSFLFIVSWAIVFLFVYFLWRLAKWAGGSGKGIFAIMLVYLYLPFAAIAITILILAYT